MMIQRKFLNKFLWKFREWAFKFRYEVHKKDEFKRLLNHSSFHCFSVYLSEFSLSVPAKSIPFQNKAGKNCI